MKKSLSLLVMSLLALVLAVPAFAAAKPIDVFINGSKVSFTSGAPYLQNNTILVPFRVVFEKLGLQVLWNAKTGTVTGTGSNLAISLKIGSNRATVNGTAKKLTIAPVTSGGTTYIPLRFIAEATGGTAVWNPANRSVQIQASAANPAVDSAAITALIHLSTKYYNEENAADYFSLVDPESSYSDAAPDIKEQFALYDLKMTIDKLEILDLKAGEATVYTTETTRRLGGAYYPDEQNEYFYTLVRKNGKWKISDIESDNRTFLLTREQGMKAAEVPQADSTAIQDTLKKYYQFLNEQNAEGVVSTMTSYGAEYDESLLADFEDFFNSYDITYTLGRSNIYYYSSTEAAVYLESKEKEASEKESYEVGEIFTFTKSDKGVWTIENTYSLFSKQL